MDKPQDQIKLKLVRSNKSCNNLNYIYSTPQCETKGRPRTSIKRAWSDPVRVIPEQSNQEMFKPRLKRTKSILSLKKAIETAFQDTITPDPLDTPQIRTRLQSMRHVLGFRKYNRLLILFSASLEICRNINAFISRRQTAFDSALTRVNESIEGLRVAESAFYKICDSIIEYEKKSRELEFLKKNIGSCIRNSIFIVKNQLTEYEDTDYQERSKINDYVQHPWSDHITYRIITTELMEYLMRTGTKLTNAESEYLNCREELTVIHEAIKFIQDYCVQSRFRQLLDAGTNLQLLQHIFYRKLKPIEIDLNTKFQESQVITEALISLSFEIGSTKQLLDVRAKEIEETSRKYSLNIYEEKCAILEFIEDGRDYMKRELAEAKQTSQQEEFNRLPPLSPVNMNKKNGQMPIWTQSWMNKSPKIHSTKRKANLTSHYNN